MNKPVHIPLADPFGSVADGEVESGRLATPAAVVEAGLRRLEREQEKLRTLHQALIEGEERGPSRIVDPQALAARAHVSWKNRG